jgi:hypothetical protein
MFFRGMPHFVGRELGDCCRLLCRRTKTYLDYNQWGKEQFIDYSSRQVKEGNQASKVSILHLSSDVFSLSDLTFVFEGGFWNVFDAHNPPLPVD